MKIRPVIDLVERSRGEVIDFLRTLVRIPSVTGQEAGCAEVLEEKLRALGLAVTRHEAEPGRPNLIARWEGSGPGPSILLYDHMDVVPPGPRHEWSVDPFGAEVRDGRMYGRGTVDSKSGLTAMIMAVEAVLRSGLDLGGRLTVAAAVDEERGGAAGICHLLDQGLLQADMAVVVEPSTLGMEIAQRGAYWAEVTTSGRAAHGARPWLGVNAIDQMFLALRELERFERRLRGRKHRYLHAPTINVGTISGGTVVNMVPSFCRAEIDRRLLADETDVDVAREFDGFFADLRGRYPALQVDWCPLRYWPSMEIRKDEPVVVGLRRAFKEVTGRAAKVAGKDAATDASWIVWQAGIPTAIFGPADGLKSLTADEFVDLEDVMTGVKVLAIFLARTLGGRTKPVDTPIGTLG